MPGSLEKKIARNHACVGVSMRASCKASRAADWARARQSREKCSERDTIHYYTYIMVQILDSKLNTNEHFESISNCSKLLIRKNSLVLEGDPRTKGRRTTLDPTLLVRESAAKAPSARDHSYVCPSSICLTVYLLANFRGLVLGCIEASKQATT